MRRPPLTAKVIRGLEALVGYGIVADYVSGSASIGYDEAREWATDEEINDARAAYQWIINVKVWHDQKKRPRQKNVPQTASERLSKELRRTSPEGLAE